MYSNRDIGREGGGMAGRNGAKDLGHGTTNLRRSPLAWAKFLGLCAVIVVGPGFLITALLQPSESGNPRRNPSPAEEVRQAEVRAEAQYYRRQQRYWIDRVEAGEISFSEAACEFERGGEWDSERELCLGERHHQAP